jgi:predicted nucleotidyltransferase
MLILYFLCATIRRRLSDGNNQGGSAVVRKISNALIEEMTRRLVAEFHPEEVILFGSHAWGTPNEDSDVDLLVIVPYSDIPPTQRAMRAYRCLRGLLVPVDVLVKTRAEVERFRHVRASLERKILEQGRALYGRSEATTGAKLVD